MYIKRVVYTAIFNKYDKLHPIHFESNCDFICFTDDQSLKSTGWNIIYINDRSINPAYLNRKIKILTHLYLSDYDQSLYVDGNISIRKNPEELFAKYLNNKYFIAIPEHSDRDCVYLEAAQLLKSQRFDIYFKNKIQQQIDAYKIHGLPNNYGFTENNVILRSHNNNHCVELANLWWREYNNGCKRDQIGLPYLLWLHNISVRKIAEGPRFSNKFFNINLHSFNGNFIRKYVILSEFRRKQSIIAKLNFLVIFKFRNFFNYIKNHLNV